MNTDVKFAGFWRRLAAHLIDAVIMGVPFWIILAMVGFEHFMASGSGLMQLLGIVFGMAYYSAFLSSSWQATPGKRLMGVYVVRAQNHDALCWKHALCRYAVYLGPTLLMMVFACCMGSSGALPGLSPEDQQHFNEIRSNMMHLQPMTPEDNEFMREVMEKSHYSPAGMAWHLLSILAGVYFLALALTVGLTREKTGIHDMLCKTRALRGRPEEVAAT